MTYFQTFYHYVHAHKILSSENFYWKNDGSFKMLTIYYSFWQLWAIFALVFKLPIIMCTLAKFCHLKIFTKNGGSFKMLTIYYSFRQLWAIFVTKLMKRSTIFFNILKLPLYFYMFTKFHDQQIKKKKKAVCFNMWTKSCLLQQLWTIFSTKIMKNSTIFVTYF